MNDKIIQSQNVLWSRICGLWNFVKQKPELIMSDSYSRFVSFKAAFTLIELSIVLVIFGLFTGGIMVGKDLIHSAEIRSQIKQFEEYSMAYNDYKIKFNCTAGDCAKATEVFGTTDPSGNTINNGNGNGYIDTELGDYYDNNSDHWSASIEMWGAFQQLGLANMVSFVPKTPTSYVLGTSHPALKINNKAGFFFGANYNFLFNSFRRNPSTINYIRGVNAIWAVDCASNGDVMGGWDNNCGVFTATDLQQIDQKLDDGAPLSGKLIGFGGYNSNNNCLISGNTAYDLSYTTKQCQAGYVVE